MKDKKNQEIRREQASSTEGIPAPQSKGRQPLPISLMLSSDKQRALGHLTYHGQ